MNAHAMTFPASARQDRDTRGVRSAFIATTAVRAIDEETAELKRMRVAGRGDDAASVDAS